MTPVSAITPEQAERIHFTDHVVERFGVRMRPGLSEEGWELELRRLVNAFGTITLSPPRWVSDRSLQRADAYLLVGDDLVLPLVEASRRSPGEGYVAVTALVRGCVSDISRARRNAGRRRRPRRY